MADYIDACQGSCGASPHDLTKQFRLGMPSWHDMTYTSDLLPSVTAL